MRAELVPRALFALLNLCALALTARALKISFNHPNLFGGEWVVRTVLLLGGIALLASLAGAWRRPHGRSWGLLRYLFELTVLSSAVFMLTSPFRKLRFDLATGLAAALWGFVFITWLAMGSRTPPKWLRAFDLALFNLCLLLFLTEAGLRLAASFSASPLLVRSLDRSATVIYRHKSQEEPGRLRFGFPLNSGGYYDTELAPPPPGGSAIAMIGDSFSYGVVPHYFHFSTVCERQLKSAEVYNIGYPAIGPWEYLYLLRHEVMDLKPDLIVVNIFVGNDITDADRSVQDHPFLRRYWDRGNCLSYLVPRRLGRMLSEAREKGSLSAVARIEKEGLERRIHRPKGLRKEYPWLKDPSLEKPTLIPYTFLKIETERALQVCDPRRASFSPLFEALTEMREVAGEVPFMVQILPDFFQIDDTVWREIVRGTRNRHLARILPQQKISQWLDEQGIPYLDLRPEMRARCSRIQDDPRHCYHLRDTHWNAHGNQVAGQAMARFLTPYVSE